MFSTLQPLGFIPESTPSPSDPKHHAYTSGSLSTPECSSYKNSCCRVGRQRHVLIWSRSHLCPIIWLNAASIPRINSNLPPGLHKARIEMLDHLELLTSRTMRPFRKLPHMWKRSGAMEDVIRKIKSIYF